MKTTKLSKGAIEVMLHKSESISEFILLLYKAVVEHDWDLIKEFNTFPGVNRVTATWIIAKASEKYDSARFGLTWMNNGFSSNYDSLKDFEVALPNNLYTLKNLKIFSEPEVEEYFNEDKYDQEKSIKKEV